MMPVGDFEITNLTEASVGVPRSILVIRYKWWNCLPARRRVEGFGPFHPVQGRKTIKDRLHWQVEPPILTKGEVLSAKVCLVDHLGGENWTKWLQWPSM